jgi:hypothetical protein
LNRQVVEDDGLFPKPPTREEIRRVNPQDPFA